MKKIVVHCSDSPQGRGDNAETIHRWHKTRIPKFDGIGYHYVILENGLVENGRPEYWAGAHVKGHNTGSIGICLIGIDSFTERQYQSLGDLLKQLIKKYPGIKVCGHRDLDSGKTCPNFEVRSFMQQAGIKDGHE